MRLLLTCYAHGKGELAEDGETFFISLTTDGPFGIEAHYVGEHFEQPLDITAVSLLREDVVYYRHEGDDYPVCLDSPPSPDSEPIPSMVLDLSTWGEVAADD